MPINNAGVDRVPGHLAADQASIHEEDINVTQVYRAVSYQSTEFVGVRGTLNGVVRDHVVTQIPRQVLTRDRASIQEEDIDTTQVYRTAQYQSTEAVVQLTADIQSGLPNMVLAAPAITSIDPTSGLEAGGYGFTIDGTDFVTGATVAFGANPATGLSVSSTQITGTVPAGALGAVTVTVTNPDAQFDTTSFTYIAAPVPTLDFEPDLGGVGTRFSSSLTTSIPFADLVVASGAEGNATVKGFGGTFRLTINGTTYEIPASIRRKIRAKRGGRVFWQAQGDSGSFRYFRHAPPVFVEEESVL
jgi:hypothetical protein